MKPRCPFCKTLLAPGAPEQKGKASSYRCFKCDIRFILPTKCVQYKDNGK